MSRQADKSRPLVSLSKHQLMSKWEKHATYFKKGLVNNAPHLMIPVMQCLHGYLFERYCLLEVEYAMVMMVIPVTLEYVLVPKRGYVDVVGKYLIKPGQSPSGSEMLS